MSSDGSPFIANRNDVPWCGHPKEVVAACKTGRGVAFNPHWVCHVDEVSKPIAEEKAEKPFIFVLRLGGAAAGQGVLMVFGAIATVSVCGLSSPIQLNCPDIAQVAADNLLIRWAERHPRKADATQSLSYFVAIPMHFSTG